MASSDSNEDQNQTSKRISISAARKMLGMVGRNYSDADIERLLDHLYGIAGSAFEQYLDIAFTPPDDKQNVDPDTPE